jgi:hypothetical protein
VPVCGACACVGLCLCACVGLCECYHALPSPTLLFNDWKNAALERNDLRWHSSGSEARQLARQCVVVVNFEVRVNLKCQCAPGPSPAWGQLELELRYIGRYLYKISSDFSPCVPTLYTMVLVHGGAVLRRAACMLRASTASRTLFVQGQATGFSSAALGSAARFVTASGHKIFLCGGMFACAWAFNKEFQS